MFKSHFFKTPAAFFLFNSVGIVVYIFVIKLSSHQDLPLFVL
jgi:hypothetical protein